VCHAGGNYGEPFNAKRSVTQGGPLSSLMFNMCVDAAVREWLCQTLDEAAARDGIGNQVAQQLVAFYIDNGLIASQDPGWLQNLFNILLGLFELISLFTNLSKTKVMVCILGRIHEAYTEEKYVKYKSPTGASAGNKHCWIDYEICSASLAAGSYQSHLESQQGGFLIYGSPT
jgi:hypothetical protein